MRGLVLWSLLVVSLALPMPAWADEVRIKDLGRFLGWRDNALVGYGIVTGLAGSGDSPRSEVTRQALSNVLGRLGTNISSAQLRSRNVAAVIVTATLPPTGNPGDRIDVTVSSIGDARSLAGGSLLMTPLLGPDRQPYALAQGALVVGGYRFDADLNRRQRNFPTTAVLPGGATIETSVTADLVSATGDLVFVLRDPDFTTAERIAEGVNRRMGFGSASVESADRVRIATAARYSDPGRAIALIENIMVEPAASARVVINERSGTVVAGGDVRISSVVITQGDIEISVESDRYASQPILVGSIAPDARSLIVNNSRLEVTEREGDAVASFPNTTVADLVRGLAEVNVGTRDMIAILQAIEAAGALHAEIIVQ
ncbi:MAG: flagellar basal body P-ring protein FlgI [Pseudomonadota bacterium]